MVQDRTHGLCVLDPHGDLIDEMLELVPDDRIDDVILFDPMDTEYPFGLNLLSCDRDDPRQVRWVVSTVMGTLRRLFEYSWGPRLEHVLRHTLLTAMQVPDSTFLELLLLLTNESYRNRIVDELKDPIISQFWADLPRSHRERYELISSTLNKISPFITDRSMRNIIGQSKNTFDLQSIMDQGKIIIRQFVQRRPWRGSFFAVRISHREYGTDGSPQAAFPATATSPQFSPDRG